MSDGERDYQVGPGKPPLHTRFRKGQSGNPRGRSAKDLPVLLADALNEPVYLTTNGRRRKITKREAVIAQLVNKSADADLRATKMLIDMLTDIEKKTGAAPPPPGPAPLTEADEEVMQSLVERVRRQVLAEIAAKNAAENSLRHRPPGLPGEGRDPFAP